MGIGVCRDRKPSHDGRDPCLRSRGLAARPRRSSRGRIHRDHQRNSEPGRLRPTHRSSDRGPPPHGTRSRRDRRVHRPQHPFVEQVALMGLEITGLARRNFDDLWIDPIDYQPQLAEAARAQPSRNPDDDLLPPTLRPPTRGASIRREIHQRLEERLHRSLRRL